MNVLTDFIHCAHPLVKKGKDVGVPGKACCSGAATYKPEKALA